jgi:hypothetical protein
MNSKISSLMDLLQLKLAYYSYDLDSSSPKMFDVSSYLIVFLIPLTVHHEISKYAQP